VNARGDSHDETGKKLLRSRTQWHTDIDLSCARGRWAWVPLTVGPNLMCRLWLHTAQRPQIPSSKREVLRGRQECTYLCEPPSQLDKATRGIESLGLTWWEALKATLEAFIIDYINNPSRDHESERLLRFPWLFGWISVFLHKSYYNHGAIGKIIIYFLS